MAILNLDSDVFLLKKSISDTFKISSRRPGCVQSAPLQFHKVILSLLSVTWAIRRQLGRDHLLSRVQLTHIHTYMHTYVRTYIHTYVHGTHIHTYIHTIMYIHSVHAVSATNGRGGESREGFGPQHSPCPSLNFICSEHPSAAMAPAPATSL